MEILKLILNFLLEIMKIGAALVQHLKKDDHATYNGPRHKFKVPKSILSLTIVGFFGAVTTFLGVLVILITTLWG